MGVFMLSSVLRACGVLAVATALAACGSGSKINDVRFGSLEEWGPIAIEDQLRFWDCSTVDWSVEEEHDSFSTVAATCSSISRTTLNSKLRQSVCLGSREYKHHCLDLFDVEEKIRIRFALYEDGRVSLLDGSEQRVKKGEVLSEVSLPLSFLANIRDQSFMTSEVAYATLDALERDPKKIDVIWGDLIMGLPQTRKVEYQPQHLEIAQFIKKRLKEVYAPGDMAYAVPDLLAPATVTE